MEGSIDLKSSDDGHLAGVKLWLGIAISTNRSDFCRRRNDAPALLAPAEHGIGKSPTYEVGAILLDIKVWTIPAMAAATLRGRLCLNLPPLRRPYAG